MKQILIVAASLLALTACGAATSTPTTSVSNAHPGHPFSTSTGTDPLLPAGTVTVTKLPRGLLVGVGRSALIQGGDAAHVIVAGGLVVGDTTTDVVQQVDLATGQTTKLSSLAVRVHDTAGASLPNVPPLVIGGGNSSEQSVVQAFANGAWRVVGHLPATRSDLSAVSFAAGAGRVWILGGYDGSTPAVATVLAGDMTGSAWRPVGALAVAVRYTAAVYGPDGKIYLFGGEASGAEKDTVQTWDPQTGKGAVVAHLPQALGHMSAVAVGAKFLVMGGRTDASSGAMTDRMWWFDPATQKFTDAGRLPYPVADAVLAAGGDGYVYLIGGESPHPITTILKIQVTQ